MSAMIQKHQQVYLRTLNSLSSAHRHRTSVEKAGTQTGLCGSACKAQNGFKPIFSNSLID